MRIIRKADKILTVSKRWDEQYRDDNDLTKIKIGNRLRNKKTITENEITEIIGNNSWTKNLCYECGNDCDSIILFGEESDYESSTFYVCHDCLKKAIAFFNPSPTPPNASNV